MYNCVARKSSIQDEVLLLKQLTALGHQYTIEHIQRRLIGSSLAASIDGCVNS